MEAPWVGPPDGRRRRYARGFSLAEVLIAMVVLVVGFLGLITMVWGGFSTVQEAGLSSAAIATAESMIETLRTQPGTIIPQFDRVTTADPTSCPGAAGSFINTACQAWLARVTALPAGAATVSVATAPSAVTGIPFHTVTVTISWAEVGRGDKSIVIASGITD